jgi:hypothetical protein
METLDRENDLVDKKLRLLDLEAQLLDLKLKNEKEKAQLASIQRDEALRATREKTQLELRAEREKGNEKKS